jgi:hypothetical protein
VFATAMPTRTFRKVVLPAPDEPMTAVRRPGWMTPLMPFRISLLTVSLSLPVVVAVTRRSS